MMTAGYCRICLKALVKFVLPVFIPAASLLLSCTPGGKATFKEKEWAARVEATRAEDLYAPHHKDGRFFAPWMAMGDKGFTDVLQWKLSPTDEYTPRESAFLPEVIPDTAHRLADTRGDFILWIGHNTFLIRIDSRYWLTDPIFSKRALVPARKTPPAIGLKELNALAPAPTILISHNHYDHLDRASVTGLNRSSPVYVPLGLKSLVTGMNKPRVTQMDWWEEASLGNGIRLVCLPAQHWSMRISQGRNKSLWAAWLLITPRLTLFFGGDSGYFKGFREIGKRFPGIDYAFMATTAYHPRWFMHYQHMNVPEAVKAFEEFGARVFIPTQWGTFDLGSEPAGYPGLDLIRFIRTRGLAPETFKILDIGQILPI